MIKRTSFLFFLLSIFILGMLESCATTANVPDKKNTETVSNLNYKIISIKEKTDYLVTDIEYPEFNNLPVLNKYIKNSVVNYYESFKKTAETDWKNSGINSPFEFNTKTKIFSTPEYESILLKNYTFTGGAHGYTTLTSYNYDLNTKKFVNILEVSKLSYKEISQFCNSQLLSKFLKTDNDRTEKEIKEWINEGTFPTPDNFEIFTVDNKNITVYFEEYSVAPYSYGIQEVKIPRK